VETISLVKKVAGLGAICSWLVLALGIAFGQTPPQVSFNARRDFLVGGAPSCFAVGDFNGDGTDDLVVFDSQPTGISVLLGNGDGTFKPAVTVASSITAAQVAVADFNGDGKLDLVVAGGTSSSSDIWILLGNGDGTFQAPKAFTVPFGGTGIAVGDFNGDGKVDLAMVGISNATTLAGEVLVFLGNGDGTLQSPNAFPLGINPTSVAVGDFNGDGKLDLVAVNRGDSTLSILLGKGDGTFGTTQNITGGALPLSVAVADFNSDGRADLAVADVRSGILIFLGNGDGTFQTPKTFPANLPLSVSVGDFNGDGKFDTVSLDSTGRSINILLGNGDGTFGLPASFIVPETAFATAVADVNHDGKADVLTLASTALSGPETVSVLLGNGDGTFVDTPAPVSSNGLAVVEGDFNRDGKADLAAASGNGVVVMLGTGEGAFQSGVSYPVGGIGATAVSVLAGDFNHDGITDLAAISQNPGTVSIFLGNGDGAFQAANSATTGNNPISFALADFNGDGKLDVAVLDAGSNCAQSGSSDLVVFLGNGDGSLQVGRVTTLSSCSSALAAGDFNGDGKVDLIFGDGTVFLGNGDGTFQTQSTTDTDTYLAVADFNRDGKLDFAAATLNGSTVTVFLGNGNGTFQPGTPYGVGTNPNSVTVVDVNGDSIPDLVTGNYTGSNISLLLGNGDGTFGQSLNFGTQVTTVMAVEGDFNGDGKPDLAAISTKGVTVLINVSQGPGASASPANLSFGNQPMGTKSPPQTVTLLNSGNAPLTINTVSIVGAESGDFSQANNCGASIAVGASCAINVAFQPSSTGIRSATLSISDNAAGSPETVPLSGTGASASLGLSVSSGGSSMQTVAAGQTASYTLSIGGGGLSGIASLTCTGAPQGAACSVPASVNVNATTASTFTVNVTTMSRTLAASRSGTLHFHGWWAIAMFGFVILPAAGRRGRSALRLLPLALLLLLCSCGGSNSSSGPQPNPNGTPAGTYTLTVSATSGSTNQSIPLTLNVQ